MRKIVAGWAAALVMVGCGGDAERILSEDPSLNARVDVSIVEPADTDEPLVDPVFTWTVTGEGEGEYFGNLGQECKMEKEGQYYLSATFFQEGNLTVGIRYRTLGEFPMDISIVGLNQGQDPDEGAGLANLSGTLLPQEMEWEGASGQLSLLSENPCEGTFELTFREEGVDSEVFVTGEFLLPIQ